MKKTQRKSPTLGKKPPTGAITLFDGSNKDEWHGGRLDEKTRLLNTDGSDIRTKRKFNDYHMHLEFLLPYRPAARGQGGETADFTKSTISRCKFSTPSDWRERTMNAVAFIRSRTPDVNACFPPLSWQTYDVDFTNAKTKRREEGPKREDHCSLEWYRHSRQFRDTEKNRRLPWRTGRNSRSNEVARPRQPSSV